MAGSTILGRWNVVFLRILAGGNCAVMARITSFTSDIRAVVIDKGISKIRFVMTNRTITSGIAMDRSVGFTPGSQGNVVGTPVMTGGTVVTNFQMTECGWFESRHGMAKMAILQGGQMSARLDDIRLGGEEKGGMASFATMRQILVHR